jgi:5'-3' exonuclease
MIEWFGIDFNSLMHPVCASMAASEEKTDFKKRQNWNRLYEAIYVYLMKILQECSSSGSLKEVYIAIDGVVPMAKIL